MELANFELGDCRGLSSDLHLTSQKHFENVARSLSGLFQDIWREIGGNRGLRGVGADPKNVGI